MKYVGGHCHFALYRCGVPQIWIHHPGLQAKALVRNFPLFSARQKLHDSEVKTL